MNNNSFFYMDGIKDIDSLFENIDQTCVDENIRDLSNFNEMLITDKFETLFEDTMLYPELDFLTTKGDDLHTVLRCDEQMPPPTPPPPQESMCKDEETINTNESETKDNITYKCEDDKIIRTYSTSHGVIMLSACTRQKKLRKNKKFVWTGGVTTVDTGVTLMSWPQNCVPMVSALGNNNCEWKALTETWCTPGSRIFVTVFNVCGKNKQLPIPHGTPLANLSFVNTVPLYGKVIINCFLQMCVCRCVVCREFNFCFFLFVTDGAIKK